MRDTDAGNRDLALSDDLHGEPLEIQMGPSHPATHGTVRISLKLDGERIVDCDVQVGYLHRGYEKECESGEWSQAIPYTDRLNYASPMINNVGYCLAAEKLLGVTVPPRGQYIRTIASEISRLSDHFTCLGASAMELAAMTPFLYGVQAASTCGICTKRSAARASRPTTSVSAACRATCHPASSSSVATN